MKKITTIKQIGFLLLIAIFCGFSTVFAQIPGNDLAAYYSINGNANDLSVNHNDGTVTNAVLTTDRNGNQNSAWYFDGDEDYITVPHSSTLNFTTGLTVGFWVKVENTGCQIVTKGNAAGGFVVQYLAGNILEFKLIDNIGGELSIDHTFDILNSWHYIAGTYDGVTAKLYLDGSEVLSQSFTGDIGSTSDLTFGKEIVDWTGGFFQGSLDDMFLFNRALTSDEISQIYTGNLDGTWVAANSPYFVCNDVQIDAYKTHTIDPGVEVYFTNQYEMTVSGCLVADGDPGNEILFSATDTVGINLGSDKGWNGIEFLNTNTYGINTSVLDYCNIEYISYIFVSKENRGAVYVYQSDKTQFTNCTVQNNFNLNSGGGIYFDHSEGKIENCTIQHNQTNGFGGGLLLNNCTSDVSISGNVIQNNTANTEGGGIYVVQGSPVLDNLLIAGNNAQYGAGTCLVSTATTLQNSLINGNNQAEKNGGGVFISQGAPQFNNVTISNNAAVGDGGGIYIYKGTPTFEVTTIESNTALNGGGLCLKNYTSTFTGANIISNNANNLGGGIYISGGTPEISYILVNDNNADTQGDAIYNDNSTTDVINITCYSNGDDTNEELVFNETGTMLIENSILWDNNSNPSSNVTINYSDIEGGFAGPGNINSDPLFVDPYNNDFHLKWPLFPDILDPERSPCIDVGNPYNWLTNPDDRELDGSRRDMGVYYYHQNPIVSIWDNDASPHFYDFGVVNTYYDSVKYFKLKNDIDAFFECPVYFAEHIYPTEMGFTIENGPIINDTVPFDLTPFQEVDVKTHFIPTITDDARKYLFAGDPSYAPNHDSIHVKGTGKGIGTIQGHITTANQHYGVENIAVHIVNSPTLDIIVYTDADGYYYANNIGLGIFTVTPSFEIEGYWQDFNPVSAAVTLSETNDSKQQNFTIVSAYNVSGHVYYESTFCPVEGVVITHNNTESVVSDENGFFLFYDVLKGLHEFNAVLEGHVFSSNPLNPVILSQVENLDFIDEFTYELSCSILGGCEIILNPFIEVTINNNDPCDILAYSVPLIDGIGSINLPPGNYHVENNFFIFNGASIDAGTFSDDIDLTQGDTIAAFILETDRYISPTWATSGLQYYEDGVILYQDSTYDLKIELYEFYGSDSCFLDEGQITVIDNVSITQGDTTISINDSCHCAHYQFVAGDPNIVPPYAKTLTIQHEYGNSKSVVSENITVYILGENPRGEAFATTSPEIPLMILRDPPGDQSYSYFIQTNEVTSSFSMYAKSDLSTSDKVTVSLGLDFDVTAGFIISTTTSTDVTLDASSEFNTKMSQNSRYENTLKFTTQTDYRTSNADAIGSIGSDADVYIGAAINFVYGLTDIVFIENDTIKYKQGIIMAPVGFETLYTYNEYNIIHSIIPGLILIGDTSSANAWQEIMAYKYYLESIATNPDNISRSFSGDNSVTDSETFTKTDTWSYEFDMSIDLTLATAAGVHVNGIGVLNEASVTIGYTAGASTVNSSQNSTTIGYHLEDHNIGDNITVKIYKDPVYGTPIFKNETGITSCPWEGFGSFLDTCNFLNHYYVQNQIPAGELANFSNVVLQNLNSSQIRLYRLRLLSETASGVLVECNGVPLTSSTYQEFYIDPNSSVNPTITIERVGTPYVYDGITLLLASPCEDDLAPIGADPQLGDYAYFHVEWIAPCTYLKLAQPANNWIVNSLNDTLQLIITEYDTVGTGLEAIHAEYSTNGGILWTQIFNWARDTLPENYLVYKWVPPFEGNCMIRAIAVCEYDTYTSESRYGIIDKTKPQLLLATPQDHVLSPNDQISFTFTEALDPVSVNKFNCTLWSLANGGQIDANVALTSGTVINFFYPEYLNYYLENSWVEARIENITDLQGNPLAQMATHDFLIDMGPLKWNPTNFVQYYPSGITVGQDLFTSTLTNVNAGTVYYTVDNLPWLSASSSSGSLPGPSGSIVESFTSATDQDGVYIDTIHAGTLFWPDELVYVQVVIGDVAPVFIIQPRSQFANIGDSVRFEAHAQGARPLYYTWYKNGAVASDPNIIMDDSVLIINPVDATDFTDYYCRVQNTQGSAISDTVSLSENQINYLDLKVLLDGPFNGTEMNTGLNSQLPLTQPYSGYPWNYTGSESVGAMLNTDIVDWVLVELRDATNATSAIGATKIWQQACFLQKDGSIIDISGNMPFFEVTVTNSLFVVIYHRNHIGIMSAYALSRTDDTYIYDFTTPLNQAFGSNSQKELSAGVWGLWAADGDASGIIDDADKNNIWLIQAGLSGYLSGDFDMNAQVANPDKNDKWVPNIGKQSNIPQ